MRLNPIHIDVQRVLSAAERLTRSRLAFYARRMARTRGASKRVKPAAGYSALASRIFERWGGAGEEVALDRLVSEFGDAQRYDVVAALKELEKSGAGEFLVGKGGRRSRFVWSARLAPSASQAAAPMREASAPRSPSEPQPTQHAGEQVSADASAGALRTLDHVFYVRPGFAATLRLPEDVTAAEIERLCRFLEVIPFAKERGAKP